MSLSENPFSPMATYDTQTSISSTSSLDPKLSRTHYFDGRLLRASDLTRDQFYLDERLREVGRALGQGIVRGLDINMTGNRKITVSGGLAITPSGRVLELEAAKIELNLTDAALINEINPGFRFLQPGLYAVVIRYAEKGTGAAEIYPRDLEEKRGFHFNTYEEGVQFALVKLSVNLPLEKIQRVSAHEVSVYIRSLLVRELLLSNAGQPKSIGEDAVALGILGVEYGMPQWLDKGLLRRPFRSVQALNYVQQDLYEHYEELFADIMALRQSSANEDKFLASRYFSILPPVGSLPKKAIDPVNAYQHFFPEKYEVSISPVRADDLPSLIQQSLALEPIDLQSDKDVDIMIAVVLDDINFSFIARRLEHTGDSQIAHFDETFLSPFNKQTNPQEEANIWQTLWSQAQKIIYLRRPVRAAETQVSAVVLAKGDFEKLPDIAAITEYDYAGFEKRLADLKDKSDKREQAYEARVTALLETIENLKKGIPDHLKEEKELVEKASVTLEATVDAFEDLQEELDKKSQRLRDDIQKLTDELSLLKGDDLQNAREQLAAALDENEKLQKQIKKLEEEIQSLNEVIKDLKENNNNNGNPNSDYDRLKNELSQVQKQLFALQGFIANLYESKTIRVDEIGVIEKLRPAIDEKARSAMELVLKILGDDKDSQSILLQLLTLMNPQYDDLNWQSLGYIFDNKVQRDALELLLNNRQAAYFDAMQTVAKELSLHDLLEIWEEIAKKEGIRRLTPLDLDKIKVLKVNQLVPTKLKISDESRASIKALTTNDNNLLKPLSQIKSLVAEEYQPLLWETLPAVIEAEKLEEFTGFVLEVSNKSLPLGLSIAASNNRFKIPVSLRNRWAEMDLGKE